jgi:hypothetical protein
MQLTRLAFIIVGRPSRGGNANGAYTHHPSDHTHRRHDRRPGAGPRGEGQHRCSMLWSEPPSGCACMVSFAGVALKSGCTHCDAPQTNTQAVARCAAARARVSLTRRHWCVRPQWRCEARLRTSSSAARARQSRRSVPKLLTAATALPACPWTADATAAHKHTNTQTNKQTNKPPRRHRFGARRKAPAHDCAHGGAWARRVQRVKPTRARPAHSAVRRRCGSRGGRGGARRRRGSSTLPR